MQITFKTQHMAAFTEKVKRLTAFIQSPECSKETVERLERLMESGGLISLDSDERPTGRAGEVEITLLPRFEQGVSEMLAVFDAGGM